MIRREDIGKYAFDESVKPAQRIIDLLNTLPSYHLRFFPDEQLVFVRNSANSFYNLLGSFNNFDVASAEPNVADARNDLLSRLSAQFQPTFNVLAPLVSFATSMAQDFQALEREARAATQAAKDQAAGILEELSTQKKIVDSIITEVRSAAAEQGVGKQAIHFKN